MTYQNKESPIECADLDIHLVKALMTMGIHSKAVQPAHLAAYLKVPKQEVMKRLNTFNGTLFGGRSYD